MLVAGGGLRRTAGHRDQVGQAGVVTGAGGVGQQPAQQTAEVIGVASADSARHTLSRWGVPAAEYRTGANGRVQAQYDAEQVRAA